MPKNTCVSVEPARTLDVDRYRKKAHTHTLGAVLLYVHSSVSETYQVVRCEPLCHSARCNNSKSARTGLFACLLHAHGIFKNLQNKYRYYLVRNKIKAAHHSSTSVHAAMGHSHIH